MFELLNKYKDVSRKNKIKSFSKKFTNIKIHFYTDTFIHDIVRKLRLMTIELMLDVVSKLWDFEQNEKCIRVSRLYNMIKCITNGSKCYQAIRYENFLSKSFCLKNFTDKRTIFWLSLLKLFYVRQVATYRQNRNDLFKIIKEILNSLILIEYLNIRQYNKISEIVLIMY